MKLLKKVFNRTVLMIVSALVEIIALIYVFRFFNEQAAWIETVLRLLSIIIVLLLVTRSQHLSSDMIWILLIIIEPVFGTALYLFLGADLFISQTFRNIMFETQKAEKNYVQDRSVLDEMYKEAPEYKGQFKYIAESNNFPFYRNEGFDYYPLGDDGFPVMLEELRKAEKFIFLEYFIIEEGKMWNSILEILKEKAKAGVEVRVMYDDLGSIGTLSASYTKQLESVGIKAVTFNRINPIINIIMNHRDHRKIMVIDGKVVFSGGVNLADEYINAYEKHGHWKDNIIMVRGRAVWSYTVMFLTNWNALRHEDEDYTVYKHDFSNENNETDGFIAPYGETPLDNDLTSQNIYLNIINQANDYVYIATPYLIIDTEMVNALILAAQRGVDVRILTPGVPDKKIVWRITRSYYDELINGGVKIVEYTPGFVHCKVFVSDDTIATVGTINLDYRSLYLHFENGTYLYGSRKILDIKKDMLDTMAKGKYVGAEDFKMGLFAEFIISVIKLFAPLM